MYSFFSHQYGRQHICHAGIFVTPNNASKPCKLFKTVSTSHFLEYFLSSSYPTAILANNHFLNPPYLTKHLEGSGCNGRLQHNKGGGNTVPHDVENINNAVHPSRYKGRLWHNIGGGNACHTIST